MYNYIYYIKHHPLYTRYIHDYIYYIKHLVAGDALNLPLMWYLPILRRRRRTTGGCSCKLYPGPRLTHCDESTGNHLIWFKECAERKTFWQPIISIMRCQRKIHFNKTTASNQQLKVTFYGDWMGVIRDHFPASDVKGRAPRLHPTRAEKQSNLKPGRSKAFPWKFQIDSPTPPQHETEWNDVKRMAADGLDF